MLGRFLGEAGWNFFDPYSRATYISGAQFSAFQELCRLLWTKLCVASSGARRAIMLIGTLFAHQLEREGWASAAQPIVLRKLITFGMSTCKGSNLSLELLDASKVLPRRVFMDGGATIICVLDMEGNYKDSRDTSGRV